jgi:hypothetical protein
MEFEIVSWIGSRKSFGRVFKLKRDQAMREASGLRPLERRFRADENAWKMDDFLAFSTAALKPPQSRRFAISGCFSPT